MPPKKGGKGAGKAGKNPAETSSVSVTTSNSSNGLVLT